MADDLNMIKFCRPAPLDDAVYLNNPHKGCCTFQRFNGDALTPGVDWTAYEQGPLTFPESTVSAMEPQVVDGFLPTTVAYCRWFWNVLEPRRGERDFSMVDGALKVCAERGQTLAVRLMPFGSLDYGQPALPEWYDETGAPMTRYRNWDKKVPVYDSDEYFAFWGDLIKEFGRRYDGNPLLESVDVAYLGPWGEGDGECSQERCDQFAELWDEAFPLTPKLSLVAAKLGDQFKSGVARRFGWRADCFGDLRRSALDFIPLDEGWNHMFNVYPRRVAEAGATASWEKGPVHFEVGFVPMTWFHRGFDIDFILQQGLKYHTTYFMPKSSRLPGPWMDKLARFCAKLGYRFIFRQAVLTRRVTPGKAFAFSAWIENVGVAPLYRRYDFAVRLRQDGREHIQIWDDIDVRQWVPGDIYFKKEVLCPAEFRAGAVEVTAGLVDPVSKKAKINFAVKERYPDRWVNLGYAEVV